MNGNILSPAELKRSFALVKTTAMSHNGAVQWLRGMASDTSEQTAFVADFALTHVERAGLVLSARPELQQRLLGFGTPNEEPGGEFSLYLRHLGGLRKVALQMQDDVFLVVQELDEAGEDIIKEWRHRLDANAPEANSTAFEHLDSMFAHSV